MSVIECDRNNCDNIQCEHQINGVGNICHDCIQDFKYHLYRNNVNEIVSVYEFKDDLKRFLRLSKKGKNRYKKISSQVDEYLKKE